jgi:hypothetical protein
MTATGSRAAEVADDDLEIAAVIMADVVTADRPNRVGYAVDCIAAAIAAARADGDRLRQRIEALAGDFDANGNGAALGDPSDTAWHKAARLLRVALDAE